MGNHGRFLSFFSVEIYEKTNSFVVDTFMWTTAAGFLWDSKMKKMIEMRQKLRGVDNMNRKLNDSKALICSFVRNSNFYQNS